MYIDPLYLILVLPAVLFSLWASAKVKNTYSKYSQVRNASGMTGTEAAKAVLEANHVYGVRIEHVSGNLTDHYDPKENVIRLSDTVYSSATPAAVGVAAHEAGHACQYAQNYAPIKIRAAIVNVTNIGSKLSIPMIIIGLVLMNVASLSAISDVFYGIAVLGVLMYGMCVVFQLVTLPTEFNASHRAVKTIEQCGLLTTEEQKCAKKVLTAAALTYVAALAVSLAQFLRLLLMVTGRRKK